MRQYFFYLNFSHVEYVVIPCLVFAKSSLVVYLDWYLPLQLPHGLPPTSLTLETEVEKRFLQDPSWLPIHDKDLAFQRFLKYSFLQKLMIVIQLTKIIWADVSFVFIFFRVTRRETNVGSLLSCSPSPLHSGLTVVRDPTTGMLLDFAEVAHMDTAAIIQLDQNKTTNWLTEFRKYYRIVFWN